ncbi:organic hydroperoxide resistance protein [Nisaea acidiphila]|uniref:Organic hydroperoxide resistance protein n=1 Tax=Nisaea acidiphila TaxID=1862145 RepID=A0A9J7ANG2_9PROT|nr:organic hydroperoxide resistance protein [Nisaea acidiphila]UUX48702.1 organic hydroperoxide resistance protein [Nisaea acidiphila]
MSVDVLYRTIAFANGGRDGKAKTHDGAFEVTLSTPRELGGAGGTGNNPEQLFAAGYAACFLGAMKFVSAQKQTGLKIGEDTTVCAEVGIGPRAEGGFGLEVSLAISMPGADKEALEDLVGEAHLVCPYSNATRNNIDVTLFVVTPDPSLEGTAPGMAVLNS